MEELTMRKEQYGTTITLNLLRLCYECPNARECETERKCVECFKAQGLIDEENREEDTLTTEELLVLYAQ